MDFCAILVLLLYVGLILYVYVANVNEISIMGLFKLLLSEMQTVKTK